MSNIINIYCDESCHLPNDKQKAMVLGALWCPKEHSEKFNSDIANLKRKYKLSQFFDIKWTKVSAGKLDFYKELVTYFFDTQELNFRAWVVPDKSVLSHEKFKQTHDDWYYKMYFNLLTPLITSGKRYHIYIDVKDTRSRNKIKKLREIISNAKYDFSRQIIERIQHVHSHDIGLLQLADILIGAMSYNARGLTGSTAKVEIIKLIKDRTGLSLSEKTLIGEQKFNLYFWQPGSRGV